VNPDYLLRLLGALRAAKLEFTAEDFADAVWLGHRLGAATPAPSQVFSDLPPSPPFRPPEETVSRTPTPSSAHPDLPPSPPDSTGDDRAELAPEQEEKFGEVYLPHSTTEQASGRKGVPFRVPAAPP